MLDLRCPACGGGTFAGGGVDGLVCQRCGARSRLGGNGILELLPVDRPTHGSADGQAAVALGPYHGRDDTRWAEDNRAFCELLRG